MADALVATPGSNADGTKMPKDKNCPFCHAPFTSSSLGRHLDLYIKDKNAKPPDNIHDVEEIRRLRGNVTRRQARTSSAKREGSTPSSAKATPIPDQSSPPSGLRYSNTGHAEGGPVRVNFNRPSWQATGVINDLPPVIRESPSYPKPRNTIRRASAKEDVIRKQDALEEKERGRAAELALKEVLDSVNAAKQVLLLYRCHDKALTFSLLAADELTLGHSLISTSSGSLFQRYACNVWCRLLPSPRAQPMSVQHIGLSKHLDLLSSNLYGYGLHPS